MKKQLAYKQIGLAIFAAFIMTACNDTKSGSVQQMGALDPVIEYAENGKVAPTQQDYKTAGVTGVDSEEKLAEINEIVEASDPKDVDTTEEIQALVKTSFGTEKKDTKTQAKTNTKTKTSTSKAKTTTSKACPTSTCGSTCNKPATCGSTCNKPTTCGSTCNKPTTTKPTTTKPTTKPTTCGSTCGSTCNKPTTCGSTCGSTCNKPATCGSTCNKPATCTKP